MVEVFDEDGVIIGLCQLNMEELLAQDGVAKEDGSENIDIELDGNVTGRALLKSTYFAPI